MNFQDLLATETSRNLAVRHWLLLLLALRSSGGGKVSLQGKGLSLDSLRPSSVPTNAGGFQVSGVSGVPRESRALT